MALDSPIAARAIRQAPAFLLSVVFALGVLAYCHNRFWWPPDEGVYAHVAERMLGGEVLNRDIQELHAGYINFANALAFRLFGDNLLSLRYPLFGMGVLGACLVFLLLMRHGALMAAVASLSFSSLSVVQFINPTPHWYCLFLVLLIIAVLTWLPRDSPWRLESLGFLVVTVLLFRQLTGVLTAIGLFAYLLAEAPREAEGKDALLSRILSAVMTAGLAFYLFTKVGFTSLAIYGVWPMGILVWTCFKAKVANGILVPILFRLSVGGVVAAAPLVLYHVLHGSVMSWLNEAVLGALSLTELEFIRSTHYITFSGQAIGQVFSFESGSTVLNGLFWFILPLLAPALGFIVLRNLVKADPGCALPPPLPFVAVFYSLVSLHYEIPIYLFYSVGLVLVALLHVGRSRRPALRYTLAAFACTLSAVGLYYHAVQPLSRGIDGTLRGERIPLVHSPLQRCNLWIEQADVELYTHLLELVEREVGPQETILAIPANPELYYLTRRSNPFRFLNSALGIRTDSDLKRVLEILWQKPPKLIFYRPQDKYNTPYSRALMEKITGRYELLEKTGGFRIYVLVGMIPMRTITTPNRAPTSRLDSKSLITS